MVSSTGEAGEADRGAPWPSPSCISGIEAKVDVSATSPVTAQAPRQTPRHGGSATAFDVQLRQQVSRARLNQQAQQALLRAVQVAGDAASSPQPEEDPVVAAWLGEAPSNPAELEFQALQARFAMRRELLRQCIGTTEVVSLLGLRNRQTPLDRIRAGTLLAIRDQGKRRYPLWQFDPDGPDGVIAGLPDVLAALPMADLIKARWLQRPQPLLDGHMPLQLLREGQRDRVLAEARAVGRGQD